MIEISLDSAEKGRLPPNLSEVGFDLIQTQRSLTSRCRETTIGVAKLVKDEALEAQIDCWRT